MRLSIFPLCLIVVTDRLIPTRFDGYAAGPVVLVRPGTSVGLLVHEQTHVRQFWRWCGLMGVFYLLSKRWRQRFEVEAYRAQLVVTGQEQAPRFAGKLAMNYGLNLTQDEALRLLTE